MTKHLLVVGGPTASGKTDWAIRLARHFGTEIISADSRQFYREMNIGTAKPTGAERALAPHHFIDNLSITQPYSVGDFVREAGPRLRELFERHDLAVLTGGSGLYIKALCEGLDPFPEVPAAVRDELEELYRRRGLPALQEELRRVDPGYYEEVDRNNPARLLRALAVYRAGGRPFSSFRRGESAPASFTPVYLQLYRPRAELYRRIDARVDRMMAAGLPEEARRLYPYREATALQTVGYQELFDHFEGKQSLPEAVELIKRNSRRFAKRQLTWMRRDGHWKHLGVQDWEIALRYIDIVRTEGLRLVQKPAGSYQSDPVCCWLKGEETVGQVALTLFKKETVLHSEKILNEYNNLQKKELLIHEAVYTAEDAPVYAYVSPEVAPFLRRMGFHSPAALPRTVEGVLGSAQAPEAGMVLLFRPGLSDRKSI